MSPSRLTAAARSPWRHRRPALQQRIRQRHGSSGGRTRASDPSGFTRSFVPSQGAGPAQHFPPRPLLAHLLGYPHAEQLPLVPVLSRRSGSCWNCAAGLLSPLLQSGHEVEEEACQHSHSHDAMMHSKRIRSSRWGPDLNHINTRCWLLVTGWHRSLPSLGGCS